VNVTAPGPRALNVHQSFAANHRNTSSEPLQLTVPLSCPYTEDPRRRASATLSLVGRWCVALSAQAVLRRTSHRV
jgi:hypothetical protein